MEFSTNLMYPRKYLQSSSEVAKAMCRVGIPPEEINKFCNEAISDQNRDRYEYADDGLLWCLTDNGTFAIESFDSLPISHSLQLLDQRPSSSLHRLSCLSQDRMATRRHPSHLAFGCRGF